MSTLLNMGQMARNVNNSYIHVDIYSQYFPFGALVKYLL